MEMIEPGTPIGESLHVARQPILDGRGRLFGYELLYRDHAAGTACTDPADRASARVLADALLGLGFDTLTDGHPAFLNVTRALLTSDALSLLPRSEVVLELLETIDVDDEVIGACRGLRDAGFALALDDFVPGSDAERLLPYVQFVKVDVLQTPLDALSDLAIRLRAGGIRLVAEKVETIDAFQLTREAGYGLFQGYYFCRPVLRTTATLPTRHLAAVRLLAALNEPELTVGALEDLIKRDLSLGYRVLRCVNSPAFGLRREVASMRQAIVLLGIGPIRSLASIWCLAELNTTGVLELVTLAAVRGRCCELLAGRVLDTEESSAMFLLGMCSLLDTMLGTPMAEAIADLPLPDAVARALIGGADPARTVLDATIAYERGAWDEAISAVRTFGAPSTALGEAYAGALRWAHGFGAAGLV
jgi:c-di-GMP phosphodiesterase